MVMFDGASMGTGYEWNKFNKLQNSNFYNFE